MAAPSSSRQRIEGPSAVAAAAPAAGPNLHSLDDACLGLILEKANGISVELSVLTLVCKRWSRVLFSQPALWRTFSLTVCPDDPALDPDAWMGAQLRLLERVAPLVRSFEVQSDTGGGFDELGARTSAGWQLADLLHRLSPASLESVECCVEFSPASMRALLRFPLLRALSLNLPDDLPDNTVCMLRQLRLRSFDTNTSSMPADLPAALPTSLTYLELCCHQGTLPDLRPLEALTALQFLSLEEREERSDGGLQLPPGAAFPDRRQLQVTSTAVQLPGMSLRAPGRWSTFHVSVKPASDSGSSSSSSAILGISNMELGAGGMAALMPVLRSPRQRLLSLELTYVALQPSTWLRCSELAGLTGLKLGSCSLLQGAAEHATLGDALGAGLQLMPRLRALEVVQCDLAHGAPAAITPLVGLTELRIQGCQLPSVPCLAAMTGLVELNLSHNKLRELPALPTAPHLRAINVAGNQELDLPAATLRALPAQAPALRELRVGATKSIAAVVELARAMPGLKIT